MAIVVGFHSDVFSSKLARWGVQRGAAEAGVSSESSAYGRGNTVGLTSIFSRGQFLVLLKWPTVTVT